MEVYLIHNKNLLIFNAFIIPLSDKNEKSYFLRGKCEIAPR